MENRRTSWSNLELLNLTNKNNHRFKKIGDYWYWFRKPDGVNEEMLSKDFYTLEHAKSYLHYNLASWRKELKNRN